MGEAKRKHEELKRTVLKFMDSWDFPPSEAEARAVAEIKELPTVRVRRYPEAQLAWMRMKQNQCHVNARFMVENDPERKTKQVTGYLVHSGNYVLHSVVERDGTIFCVTPMGVSMPEEFAFLPDPEIVWREEGDARVAYRKGAPVGIGFRTDPAENKRITAIMRARIEAGLHPLKAGEPPF